MRKKFVWQILSHKGGINIIHGLHDEKAFLIEHNPSQLAYIPKC